LITFITGFMGAGKSYIGKKLADSDSEVIFRDLDEIIFEQCGKGLANIGQLIRVAGWDKFREEEVRFLRQITEELKDHPKAIVSLGGGTLLNVENRDYLKSLDFVQILYLATPFSECYQRIKDGEDRPLAQLGEKGMSDLYLKREEGYKACANACISGSEKITSFSDLLDLF
jgi:shikimate kinase